MTKKNSNYTPVQNAKYKSSCSPLTSKYIFNNEAEMTKMMNCHFQFLPTIAFTYFLLWTGKHLGGNYAVIHGHGEDCWYLDEATSTSSENQCPVTPSYYDHKAGLL